MTRIAPQTGAAFMLRKGRHLCVTDPEGQQVSDLFCVTADDPGEWLSAARSIDFADRIYLTRGDTLYSNRCNPLLTITEDSCERHDLLYPPCSLAMFQRVASNRDYHPSCHQNLAQALAPFGVGTDTISTTFNIFMNVEVSTSGGIQILPPLSRAGDSLVLRAECDLIVGLTACAHEESNAGRCKPIEYSVQ